MSALLETTWFDEALDHAYDAGWCLRWGVRESSSKTNTYGPRVLKKVHYVRLVHPDGRDIGDEYTSTSRESAAFALCNSLFPGIEPESAKTPD